jgi:hypothetical protein
MSSSIGCSPERLMRLNFSYDVVVRFSVLRQFGSLLSQVFNVRPVRFNFGQAPAVPWICSVSSFPRLPVTVSELG